MTKLLFGVVGPEAQGYRDRLVPLLPAFTVDRPNCIAFNSNVGRLNIPPLIETNGLAMLLNGIPILKDVAIDRLLDDPRGVLTSVMAKGIEAMPGSFANGAFNALVLANGGATIFNDFMALDPLYYTTAGKTLLVSTSLQLLAKLIRPGWDGEAITEYLSLGYNFSYRTILKDVNALPPASVLTFGSSGCAIRTYASFPPDPERRAPQSEVIEGVQGALTDAIARMYSPRLRYSLSLTGGMDSRLIFLEWPGRKELMTETAGEGTSDFIKARALAAKLGNPALHELENAEDGRYLDGLRSFYELCDNPTKLFTDYNLHHLTWKRDRGADIHMSGVGGETLNGENLYLSRSPWSVAAEAIFPYSYHGLGRVNKSDLVRGMAYASYKQRLPGMLAGDPPALEPGQIEARIVQRLTAFLGEARYAESFNERFRTLVLANMGYYPVSVGIDGRDQHVFPYNDAEFIRKLCSYHPATRELRRLELGLLRFHSEAFEIPLDTTHLRVTAPYSAHKLTRVARMVLNIGFHKKVPFLQKGEPPKFRAAKYFDRSRTDLREYINETIMACPLYDKRPVGDYLAEVGNVTKFNFYSHHRESTNIKTLFRLAVAAEKFGG